MEPEPHACSANALPLSHIPARTGELLARSWVLSEQAAPHPTHLVSPVSFSTATDLRKTLTRVPCVKVQL